MKLALALALYFLAEPAQLLRVEPTNARVDVENAAVENGAVSGTLVNETEAPVKSVTLLVQYHYRWPNEYKPGPTDPGRSDSVTVSTEIPPGARVTFSQPTQAPQPLGDGGHFETTVTVMAFEQTLPAAAPAPAPAPPASPLPVPEPEVTPESTN
jgi:hypothetical protein